MLIESPLLWNHSLKKQLVKLGRGDSRINRLSETVWNYHLIINCWIALCSPPNVKLPIRDSSQISTTALIFMNTNYFRQDIWMNIWVQFHFQYIFVGRVDFIQNLNIIPPPQIAFLWHGPLYDLLKIKHMGTSWTLFSKQHLRYLGRSILEGKYFHISNCIFTMKG